ncbi:transglycosylase SLT domain-containing protein [Flavicella sp.]|uniref:lytic transglycosylase domain-containing protein n=1 Tax=Flavicella sp. TaxID=2957742 RepID=UPI003018CED4
MTRLKLGFFLLLSAFINLSFGQTKSIDSTNVVSDSIIHEVFVQQDSIIEKALANHPIVIDSLWLDTMYSSPLYEDISLTYDEDFDKLSINNVDLSTELLKERLERLNEQTPFNLEYNPELERLIKHYLKTRSKYYPKMMARALYYFPMVESYLDKYDIPLEIKYLAVVESGLNPRAKSWAGATGMWQFMYQTGKQFGLNISSYVDERQDPVKSVEAACKYLETLYKTFNDWDLALAAYNSGPGNVSKAIRRSGGHRNYWNIRAFLPRETANYLPAFYANLYVFEYAQEHKIVPMSPMVPHFATDTIRVKRTLTFDQLNETLNISHEMLQFLNPEYKLDIIPFVKDKKYAVRLPIDKAGLFVKNEKEIYAMVAKEDAEREKPLPKYFEMNQRIRHVVRSGEYLGKIANKYGVRVSDIKRWNGMKTTNLRVGQRLIIYPKRLNFTMSKINSSQKKVVKSISNNAQQLEFTVEKRDPLWSNSNNYDKITTQQIKDWNDIWNASSIALGRKLILYRKES